MAYIVTGSSGFIGSNLCRKLALNSEVYAVFNNTPPSFSECSTIHCVPFSRINDLIGIRRIDTVVHCAAVHPNSPPAYPDMEKFFHVNCMLTKKVVDVANALLSRQFIYLSTLSVYGVVRADRLDEDTPFYAPCAYGISKYMGELIVKESSSAPNRLSLRLPGVVGVSSRYPWLSRVKYKALHNMPIELYNPGASFNNLTDIDDLARFIRHYSNGSHPGYDVLNLATSEPATVLDVVENMLELTGSKSTIELPDILRSSCSISVEKLSKKYGFIPCSTMDCVSRYSTEKEIG